MAINNCECAYCGNIYHHCSNCMPKPDLDGEDDTYCSVECYEAHKDPLGRIRSLIPKLNLTALNELYRLVDREIDKYYRLEDIEKYERYRTER